MMGPAIVPSRAHSPNISQQHSERNCISWLCNFLYLSLNGDKIGDLVSKETVCCVGGKVKH